MDHCERLRRLLLKKSYRKGTFTLTSGKTSDFYIDCKQTTLSAEGAYLCGQLLFRMIKGHGDKVEAVGGMTLGADPLVTAVAVISILNNGLFQPLSCARRQKDTAQRDMSRALANLRPGSGVALVEDVVTTGGTLLRTIARVEG